MNYKLNADIGYNFHDVAIKAKEISIEKNVIVEFDFNERKVLVNNETNLDWLERDFMNSYVMNWKTIGYNCVEEYPKNLQLEIENAKREQQIKSELQRELYRKKEAEEKKVFESKVEDIEMEFSDKGGWDLGLSKNTDGYGNCVYQYAEGWAKLMQIEINNGKEVKDIASETSNEMDFLGITGFMYGASVSILSQCWKYGEELRKWHNKEYNHEGEGVVNPAILTVK